MQSLMGKDGSSARLAWMLVLLGLISGFVVGGQRLAESGFDTVEIAVDRRSRGRDLAKPQMDGLLAEITDWESVW